VVLHSKNIVHTQWRLESDKSKASGLVVSVNHDNAVVNRSEVTEVLRQGTLGGVVGEAAHKYFPVM